MLKQKGGLHTRRTCKRHFQSAGAALKQQTLQSKARHTWIGLAFMYRQSAQACTDERVLSPVTVKPIILNTETRWESLWGSWIQMPVPVQHLFSFDGKNQCGWKRIIYCYVALTLFITGVLDHWISNFPLLSHQGLCYLIYFSFVLQLDKGL